jgi:hypothetical protein
MLFIHVLKRYFPNTPNWVLGGLLLTCILWLVVLPIEIVNTVINRDYFLPESHLGWVAKILYIKGYLISMSWIPSLRGVIRPVSLISLVVVLLGLLISSPGYFVTGALLSTRNVTATILGILLVVINLMLSFYVIIGLSILSSG